MKKLALSLAFVVGLSGLAACNNNSSNNSSNGSSNDAVVVKTKAGNITESQLVKTLKDRYGSDTLQELVYMKLLESKYKVSSKAVQNKINADIQQYGGAAAFQQALAQNNMTESQYKQLTKEQLLLQQAQEDGVKVTPKQEQDYFNKNKSTLIEVKASHILVKDKKTADKVENLIKNGGDFAKLAKKYSTDTNSAQHGGDLGWFHKADMVKPFSDKAFSMKVGQISEPVKSSYGYHIIKLTGRKDTLKQLQSTVKKAVMQNNEKSVQTVLNNLNKNGGIKVKDKQFKNLFTTTPSTGTSSSSTGQ